ncbi:peptide-methionine (R)-S-oxide reductase MsrB [Rubrivivax rivuli]|uniref:peptide-methionine (R)-S-oxide reductase n=1 Tax=Rubrivivax rivuli TaxID=1862385 RepID=A0A437RIG4_9BURK|nr:peptide-methionine (R)-S-oxide reductase MsrB [Rubrivivax rivuli]RVU46478.1 peptide-methionine (R)-S-oxide reductase [Rubrivivax rivuli]
MTRRHWMNLLRTWGLGAGAATAAGSASVAAPAAPAAAPARSDRVQLSAAEWRQRLNAAQFDVLREEGTEPPHSSPLNAEKRAGTYQCAGCALPLFSSSAKYESGTGWPSFHTPLPQALGMRTDYKLLLPRTEYHCARCGGHQGHVFSDGPRPSGLRYCNNGVALRFVPEAA